MMPTSEEEPREASSGLRGYGDLCDDYPVRSAHYGFEEPPRNPIASTYRSDESFRLDAGLTCLTVAKSCLSWVISTASAPL